MNLTLRPVSIDDLDLLVELTNNEDVLLFIPGMISDREELSSWISNLPSNDHEFMVVVDDNPVGECSLSVAGDNGEWNGCF